MKFTLVFLKLLHYCMYFIIVLFGVLLFYSYKKPLYMNIFTSLRPRNCGLLPWHTVANADHPGVKPEQGGEHQEVSFGKAALILMRCAALWHRLQWYVKEWKAECGHMDTNPFIRVFDPFSSPVQVCQCLFRNLLFNFF